MDSLYNLFLKGDPFTNSKIKFNVLLIIILILIVFNFYFQYNYSSIVILLIFALWIANYYVKYENENLDDFNNLTMAKLGKIQQKVDDFVMYKIKFLTKTGATGINYKYLYEKSKLDSLYMDANLINFLHSVIDLSKWNNELYYKLAIGTNNILGLLEEIEEFYKQTEEYPENIAEMLEAAMELRLKNINNIHDFIYTIPKANRTNRYLNSVSERYRLLITRTTDKIHSYYLDSIKQRGITNMTKFINYFDSPRAVDPAEFKRFY